MEDADTCRKAAGKGAGDASWIEFARIVRRASAPSHAKARRPFKPRRGVENGAPVISCYVFANAAVWPENPGDNR